MGWGKLAFLLSLILSTFAMAEAPKAVVIHIDGQINDYTRNTLEKRLAEARKLGAHTVILDLDTYGGAVTSGLEMSAMLKRSTDLHTIAYVKEKAISAGTMIALACNEIVMGPYAKIGDADAISIGPTGPQALPDKLRPKVVSPVVADFTESARRNGYSELLVEAMIEADIVVYWVQDTATQQKRFVDQPEYDKLMATGHWKPVDGVRNPIDSATTLLTVSTDLAVKLGLAKGEAADIPSLANQRGLSVVADLTPTTSEHVINWMNGAGIRLLLFVVFLMSLYIALHTPGMGGAEAVAAASLAALVVVPFLAGYAQWWEIVLIVLGLVLLAIELFVIPGFGFAGISGLVLIMFGFLMTFVPKEPDGTPGFLPSLDATWAAIQTGLIVIVSGMVISAAMMVWLRKFLPRLPYLNRVILKTSVGEMDTTALNEVPWPTVGDRGHAATDLRPGGSAKFIDPATGDHRFISVVSDRGFIRVDTPVVVHEIEGSRIVVREEPA
jgi:membrane-bound serine protease (ClpP class)